MDLSVPPYFDGSAAGLYPPGPAQLLEALRPILADVLNSIGQTGMAVAAIIGLILDNRIPGTPRERGLE